MQRKHIFWQEIKITLFVVISVFLSGILIGLLMPNFFKILILQATSHKFTSIMMGANSIWSLGVRIFINNFSVALILFGCSFIFFIPTIILLTNGLIIGVFLELAYNLDSLQPGMFITTILSLLPHGIFEISAFLLSAVLGINLALKLIFGRKILSPQKRFSALITYIKKFIFIILPLLVIAALFEVTISDYIINSLDKRYQQKYIDDNLKINLNKAFLVKNNCHLANAINENNSKLTVSYLEIGPAIYDQELLAIYKSISTLPHWQEIYECNGNYLKVTVYQQKDYPAEQALIKQMAILEKVNYHLKQLPNNIYQATKQSKSIFFTIRSSQGKTLIFFWEGENPEILTKLVSLV